MKIAVAIGVAYCAIFLIFQYNTCSVVMLSKLGVCQSRGADGLIIRHPVVWMAPFFSDNDYGSEAILHVLALAETGQVPKLKLIQHGDAEDAHYWDELPTIRGKELMKLSLEKVKLEKSIVICQSDPFAWSPAWYQTSACPPLGYNNSLYVIGRPMFAPKKPTREYIERLNRMDEVWVPTKFDLDVLEENGVAAEKLKEVQRALDTDLFDPSKVLPMQLHGKRVWGSEKARPYVFLSILEGDHQDGWENLIKSYMEFFSSGDNVMLYIHTTPGHTDGNLLEKIQKFIHDHPLLLKDLLIKVDNSHLGPMDLPRLYKAANAFVSTSRRPGRPLLEAMAMELPVIAASEFSESYPLYASPDGIMWPTGGLMKGHWNNQEKARKEGVENRMLAGRHSPYYVSTAVTNELLRIQHNISEELSREFERMYSTVALIH